MWRKTSISSRAFKTAVSATALVLMAAVPYLAHAETVVPDNQPKVTTQTEILASKSVSPMLTAESAAQMRTISARYEDIIANGGFPKVGRGSYKKGSEGKGTIELNRRLYMDGYLRKEAVEGEFAGRVTSATIDAITRFQKNLGLAATGKVDAATLAALNVSAQERLHTIEANIARLEAYGQNLGDRYLVVNVPAQQIETVNNGKVFSRHNAIVGRPERPTPVVMTALSDVNFNPYWNAPASIVERDIIPKLKSGTQILTDMNIKVFQGFGGPEVDPGEVDWSSAIADDYHFRQEPGPANAMATAKINFSSPFGIYLHDTPEKHLFKNGNRFYSSGCVRVEKVELLLEWVLNNQEGIGRSEISALAETLERRDVKLEAPPQLRVAYLTSWPVGNTVAFRNDVYGLDGTGFIVGQPLPEGEVSDEGQRFVLKPVPRKPGAVDAAEAEGIGLFGRRGGKSVVAPAPKNSGGLYGDADTESSGDYAAPAPKKKLPFAVKKPVVAMAAPPAEKPIDSKKYQGKKGTPGLFDWAAYRKDQKRNAGKKPELAAKTVKKPAIAKKATDKVAVVEPKAKVTPVVKKTVIAKGDEKTQLLANKKKPDVAPAVKAATTCKPGITTKECKPATVLKTEVKTPAVKKVEIKKPEVKKPVTIQ